MPPEQPLPWAAFSLLPSLCVEVLRAGTQPAQGTTACRFPHSICTGCSGPRASKTSFQRCAETKHAPGASTREVPSPETCSEPSREITSDLGDIYAGAGRTQGFPGVPCPDNPLGLEELWNDVATRVMRSSTALAQQTTCNSLYVLIMGSRGQRQ